LVTSELLSAMQRCSITSKCKYRNVASRLWSKSLALLLWRWMAQVRDRHIPEPQESVEDNGRQYLAEQHGELLTSAEIVHRRIPSCVPQYNGSAGGGMREFKSVFYNVWERRKREGADEGKNLLERVEWAASETMAQLNDAIPRPCLGGVTPADVHFGRQANEQQRLREYREAEKPSATSRRGNAATRRC
jgi:hypothetical protein